MKHLGIEMIAAYSPEARGRSERFFRTHQDSLIKELALYGITTMEEANRYIRDNYLPAFNVEFMVEPTGVPCPLLARRGWGKLSLGPHFSPGFVARRWRRAWIQGARPRAPEA